MVVAVAGGSGFLGRLLTHRLSSGGHRVVTLTRRAGIPDSIRWQPDGTAGTLARELEGVDAVVNLAGENLAGGAISVSGCGFRLMAASEGS